MPNTVTLIAGPMTSAPAVFATQTAQEVGTILREFGTDPEGLKLPVEATDQEILDACAVLAARRFRNYVKNWYLNKRIRESEEQIRADDPFEVTP